MTAPWSPSRAREAARAALCRYRLEAAEGGREAWAVELLALLDAAALDSPEALRRWVDSHEAPAPELCELLAEAGL